ncbi:MAG TPA: hypothetical protein VHD62_18505 [Opitutaceae bacterium]|nr:hypothetical protein [Opitutaceae bacterium]
MYPAGELNHLAARKALLRLRIAEHRLQCAQAADELARPLGWIDRALARWRSISPLAKTVGLPVVMLAAKKLLGRFGGVAATVGKLPRLFRSLPAMLQAFRAMAGRYA